MTHEQDIARLRLVVDNPQPRRAADRTIEGFMFGVALVAAIFAPWLFACVMVLALHPMTAAELEVYQQQLASSVKLAQSEMAQGNVKPAIYKVCEGLIVLQQIVVRIASERLNNNGR